MDRCTLFHPTGMPIANNLNANNLQEVAFHRCTKTYSLRTFSYMSANSLQKWLQRRPDCGEIAKENNMMTSGDQSHPGIPEIFSTLDEFIQGTVTIPVSIHQ